MAASLDEALSLHEAGRLDQAAQIYAEILRQDPRNFAALYYLGVVELQRSNFASAARLLGEAMRVRGPFPEALYMRGNALLALGNLSEALAAFEHAVAIAPTNIDAEINRAVTLSRLERSEEALQSYRRALALDPNHIGALYNRSNLLSVLRRYEEAAADGARVLAAEPDFPYARGTYVWCKLQSCDWDGLDAQRATISDDLHAGKKVLNPQQNVYISQSPEDQLACATIWVTNECPPAAAPLWRGERYRHDRIRVAYLSADLHEHATAHLMVGVLEAHDRSRFETFAISAGADDGSPMRARLRGAFDHFLDIRQHSDTDVAARLISQEIDILVDLKGYTERARTGILAMRPAPSAVSYLGFPGTTGAAYIDYVIADRIVIPESERASYSEQIVYLPDSYQCNDDRREIGPDVGRHEAGLPQEAFVFCCFNAAYKILPETFASWMRILHAVPGSILWLLRPPIDAAMRNLLRSAEQQGVDAKRLIFAPHEKPARHLARLKCADLFLDTLPYNAHTTASDALWAGLPLLTLQGTTFSGRVAASLLHAIGLPELVSETRDAFEREAVRLATNPSALTALRHTLAGNRRTAPLFHTARFTRNLETAYRTMWERRENGDAPRGFSVGTGAGMSSGSGG